MKYIIRAIEFKTTSTGKGMAKVSLEGIDSSSHDGVAIWEGFPNFTGLAIGSEVEGDISVKMNGRYENKSLYAPRLNNAPIRRTGASTGIAKLMDKKAENIEKAQDRKNESISFFNSTNSAIQLFTAYQSKAEFPLSDEGTKKFIIEWRNFFLSEWKKYEASDDGDKHIPF